MMRDMIKMIGTIKMINNRGANLLRYTLVLLLMILGGVMNPAWGQTTDYSGTYYIASYAKVPSSNPAQYFYDPTDPTNTNNYYLCPSDGWIYYKKDNDWTADKASSDGPFLTTFKCRTNDYVAQGGMNNAKWVITKHGNYYTFYHTGTSKYLVLSEKINGCGDDRMRVHLEAITSPETNDNALFTIASDGNPGFYIAPQTIPGDRLTVNGGNKNALTGQSGKTGGPKGNGYNYENTAGIVGIYRGTGTDDNRYFYLEEVVPRPTIAFNSDDQVVITAAQEGATLIYTTDGSMPSSSNENAITVSGTEGIITTINFDPADGVTTIKAVAVVGGELSNIATFTTPVLPGRAYLFKSRGYQSTPQDGFFMQPGDPDNNNNTTVTTSSLAREQMQWYFKSAGEDAGYLYFYIVNQTGDYLFCNSSGTVYMKSSSDFDDSSNDYKFRILVDDSGYRIVPKSKQTVWIYKNGGNNSASAVGTNGNTTNLECRWDIIRAKDNEIDHTMPAALRPTPFTPSDATTTAYYKIGSAYDVTRFIVPGATYAITAADSGGDELKWFFLTPSTDPSDGWADYYYIVNAVTGKYLCFRGDGDSPIDNTNAFETVDYSLENDDKYRFVVARTFEDDKYYIVPKLLKDKTYTYYSAIWRDKDHTNDPLKTNKSRDNNQRKWTFTSTNYTCAQPVITWSADANGYVVTPSESDAKIYYKIGDGELTPSSGTLYGGAISVADLGIESATIRAIAARNSDGSDKSPEASLTVDRVATPGFKQVNGKIELTCDTPGASIYYEMGDNPSDPTISSTPYTGPIEGAVNKVIKAIAVRGGWINSAVANSGTIDIKCATPVIRRTSPTTFTIECSFPTSGVTIYYTKGVDPADPTTSSTPYNGEVSYTVGELPFTIKAIAVASDYSNSDVVSKYFDESLDLDEDGFYVISSGADFNKFVDMVNGEGAAYHYKLTDDITVSGPEVIEKSFTGELKGVAKGDGTLPVITGMDHAIFQSINGAIVKNIILDDVRISSGTNVGAICNEATGDSRIYNCGVLASSSTVAKDEDGYDKITSCSSSISGSGYVGSIVGLLDGSSRVINCFSYANVSGGSEVGGIVGHNNVATNADETDTDHYLKTMVMNCMFYGEVSGGSIAPIYNGEIITNDGDANGVNNFNYFRLEASYIQNTSITKVYNCALGAETRFLQRFEFFRQLLNSNRELAAWWASTSEVTVTKAEIMKWVMEPTQIGSTTPYPILKSPGKYPSVVNYSPNETAYDEEYRNEGRKLTSEGDGGVLHVTIKLHSNTGSTPFSEPSGAGLKSGVTGSFDLTITDKDFKHFNYNYGKVQLPYYNDYCDGNYTGNRVVTGWKIVSISGGTPGIYSNGDDVTYYEGVLDATPYNFADRKCTKKDLYGTGGSNRVFNQGAYWDVPEGVTAITIEPYWGYAVYLADAYWDVTYKNSGTDAMATATNVNNVGGGQHYTGGTSTFNDQTIYTNIGDAIAGTALYAGANEATYSARSVYDYAVVLVGNYHYNGAIAAGGKPYTLTSVDLDGDSEPDYSLMLRFNGRTGFHPVRYDFLNLIGLGMAQKTTGGTGSYNLGIMQPKYWFEVTNTALFRVTQFEYSQKDRVKNPYILQGGVIEQWVTQQQDAGDKVSYFHVGGNVWFKEFHRGSHQDNTGKKTPHPPVSVTGGDFAKFYLTGLYQSQAAIYDDNAECYINGGRFGEVAGAGMEGIGSSDGKGNITWVIDNADITNFFGGGINFDKPVHGNIHTIISNSHVDVFCGGPKFGDMVNGRTVKTVADNCKFGTYFGAGYGGNSYNRYAPSNKNNVMNIDWNSWVSTEYTQAYNATYNGVSTQIDYQFIPMSGNVDNVARLWVEFVNFSLATTHNVTSDLTGCTITGNFYGGGSLGKVDGNVTSTLTNCTVNGNVFGAGFSASVPTVEVMNRGGFLTEPYYYTDLGTYRTAVFPDTKTYTWEHKNTISSTSDAIDTGRRILYTTEDLDPTNLGSVNGNVTLTITTSGDNVSIIGTANDDTTGYVYGGGDESYVYNSDNPANASTTVTISGNTEVRRDVFGGGNRGVVSGSTTVNIEE